jgi:hypothetical protein
MTFCIGSELVIQISQEYSEVTVTHPSDVEAARTTAAAAEETGNEAMIRETGRRRREEIIFL